MSLGLIGRKVGMTRLFSIENGNAVPVTVIDVGNNRVTQLKTDKVDGYMAIQITFGFKRPICINKPLIGHFAKAGVIAGNIVKEFRIDQKKAEEIKIGDAIDINIFSVGQKIDIQGRTIGKGYAGTIKRHGFRSGRASHGNSRAHNVPGSIGMSQDPGRVFPGKRMSGHLGHVLRTIQNLEIVRIDIKRQLFLVKGAIPGATGSNVIITPAIKSPLQNKE